MTVEARAEQPTTPPAAQEKAPAVKVDLSEQIADFDVAWRLASNLAQSSLLPEALRNRTADVLVTMMYGRDLGFSPMQSFQAIYVVKGKPMLSYQAWGTLIRKAGHKLRIIEHTAEVCTVEITRHDDPDNPHRETYTIEDAKRAGLLSNTNYDKHPRNMLYARCLSNGAKFACPEVALGFITDDEADEIHGRQAEKPTLAAAAAEREAAAAPSADPDADVVDAELVDDDPDAKDVANAAAVQALAAEHSTTGKPVVPPSPPTAPDPRVDEPSDERLDEPERSEPPNLGADEPAPRDETVEWPEVTPPGSGLPDELFPPDEPS